MEVKKKLYMEIENYKKLIFFIYINNFKSMLTINNILKFIVFIAIILVLYNIYLFCIYKKKENEENNHYFDYIEIKSDDDDILYNII